MVCTPMSTTPLHGGIRPPVPCGTEFSDRLEHRFEHGLEHFPYVLRNDLVSISRGMNPVGQVQFRDATYSLEQEGNERAAVSLGKFDKQLAKLSCIELP